MTEFSHPLHQSLSPRLEREYAALRLAALTHMHQAVWVFDFQEGRVRWANTAALKLWMAKDLDELTCRNMGKDMSPAVAQRLHQFITDFEIDPEKAFTETWTLYPDNIPTRIQMKVSGVRLPEGRMAMLCETVDYSKAGSDGSRAMDALLHTSVQITLYSIDGQPLYRNPAARAGVSSSKATFAERFINEMELAKVSRILERSAGCEETVQVHSPGGKRWHRMTVRRCSDPDSGEQAWLVSEVDVTEVKQAQLQMQQQAETDHLTGLPNRQFVYNHFARLLKSVRTSGEQAALLYMDLDNFKHINDSLGHDSGDTVLKALALRLRALLGPRDHAVRLGGDEFLLLLVDSDAARAARDFSQRLTRALETPVQLAFMDFRITATLGVSLFPNFGDSFEALMQQADLALYRGKDNGRNVLSFYTPGLAEEAQRRVALEHDLRKALERNEFELFYQPRVNVQTQQITGAEALIRWRHPERGMVSPIEFIPVCEQCGLIRQLSLWVMEEAARQVAYWHGQGQGHKLRVSINMSPRQFTDGDLVEQFQTVLEQTGAPASYLELEITESLLMGNDAQVIKTMEALAAMGLRIAIDDFGTGYSNLAYLQRYPLHCLKIDRSFIAQLESQDSIVNVIMSMCRLLGLEVVAEGVETEAQLDWLREQDCEEFQGYLFSPPLPVDAFEQRCFGA
ncbi:putative bifunctional diguanylate cyclase/phosphodiesterase [Pokkaliibacter sp. CJK22405]|uniref:putative bifunctional diguanylate cyclase/phosphodiesterase n=1 Tax=Pokkaliibacter sp. CJK22405 TaxID=3384615 RepID=UPI003984CFBB